MAGARRFAFCWSSGDQWEFAHLTDRQTGRRAPLSKKRERLARSWAVVLWPWSQEHVWLKAGRAARFRFQGRKGEDLSKVWRTSSTELPLPAQVLASKLLLSNFSQKKKKKKTTGKGPGKMYLCISCNGRGCKKGMKLKLYKWIRKMLSFSCKRDGSVAAVIAT